MKFVQVVHCHQIMMWYTVFLIGLALAGATSPPKDCSIRPHPPKKGPISKPPRCPVNEHFSDCPPNCPPQNCSSMRTRYDCSKFSTCCFPQCRCNDGYLRSDLTGQCLATEQCLISCGANAHYAVNDSNCRLTCANYDLQDTAGACKPYTGCVCDDGYVRLNDDATGICVRPQECPSRQCPCNEHWAICPNHCPDDTCKTHQDGYICKQYFVPLPCKARCYCDEGYLRNAKGKCVPFNECPDICPKHEHWEDCPTSLCPRDSCAKRNPKYKCPQLPAIPLPCYPDCVCDKGYLRDPRGVCIPEKKCPTNQTCGVNEVFNPEKILCPPQSCASRYTLYNCIRPQPIVPGCDCLPEYLRNEYGLCIRSDQCPPEPPLPPTIPGCGTNREYRKCGPTRPDTCDSINNYDSHNSVDGCVSGCFCIDGYVENNKGECIPVDECPKPTCHGSHEVYKRCGPGCDRTCEDNNRTCAAGAGACVPGCYCAKGYVRDYNGVCVRPKDCPSEPPCFLDNEVYTTCGSSCPDTCDNYKDKDRICTLQCVKGCFCKEGYVRRGDGQCVEPEQCPTDCGYNEEYSYCGSYCPITCENRLLAGDYACIALCKEGCDCVKDTLRNSSGICVRLEDCTPPKCRSNEEYKTCGTACPDTCNNYKDKYRPCTKNCVEDCFCRKGYVRNDDWKCVKPDECPSQPQCSLPHEVFSPCNAHCQDTCANLDNPNRVCTRICYPGCICEKGYYRNSDGQCVKPQECQPKTVCSRKHEVFSECGAACQRTCDNYKQPNLICPAICRPGCVCEPGYVRRHDGRCIKPRHCPNVDCPKNEHWDPCASLCPRDSCAGINPKYQCPQLPAIPLPCQPDCVCNKGYLRDPRGICIPKKNCPKDQTCGVNEVYKKCKQICPAQTCDARLELVICPEKQECIPGCDCIKGYLRNKYGQCIRAEQCNTGCGVNEKYYNCTTNCPTTCRNRFSPPQACILSCKIGCDCEPGYLRHDNGTCVLPNYCSEPECPAHSSYQECGTACPQTCRTIGKPVPPCIDLCVEGCFCDTGFVKNDLSICVRPADCKICELNERYVDCPIGYCDAKSCDDLGFPIACAGIPIDGKCEGGCLCIEGYVRNKKGVCIPKQDCQYCGGDYNATSGCSNYCGHTCSDYNKSSKSKFCPLFCEFNGCDCRKGYYYDEDRKKCVKPEDCPPINTCPKNEKYVNCVLGYCVAKTCGDLGYPIPCPGILGHCDGGCVCVEGYVRDDKGLCIPKEDCPCCGGDYNATSGCGNHCGNSCSDYKVKRDKKCPEICQLNGCDCKVGYVFDEITGKCVKAEDCSDQCDDGTPPKIECGPNENYVDCKTTCSNDFCPKRDTRAPVTCTTPDPCKPGCVCKLNHKRSNTNGQCIVSSDCPAIKCTSGPNQKYSSCPSACLAENCADRFNQPTTCNTLVLNCEPRCICKDGYFRDNNDICVLAKDCPCD